MMILMRQGGGGVQNWPILDDVIVHAPLYLSLNDRLGQNLILEAVASLRNRPVSNSVSQSLTQSLLTPSPRLFSCQLALCTGRLKKDNFFI